MKTTVFPALAIAIAAIGISAPPSAAAVDSSTCQTVGGATVCGQGEVRSGGPSAGLSGPVYSPGVGGCLTPYGTYQNCNAGRENAW